MRLCSGPLDNPTPRLHREIALDRGWIQLARGKPSPSRSTRSASPSSSLRLGHDLEDWKRLRAGWERLTNRSSRSTIFVTWDWMNCWVEAFLDFPERGLRSLRVLVMDGPDGELLALTLTTRARD